MLISMSLGRGGGVAGLRVWAPVPALPSPPCGAPGCQARELPHVSSRRSQGGLAAKAALAVCWEGTLAQGGGPKASIPHPHPIHSLFTHHSHPPPSTRHLFHLTWPYSAVLIIVQGGIISMAIVQECFNGLLPIASCLDPVRTRFLALTLCTRDSLDFRFGDLAQRWPRTKKTERRKTEKIS